ncbi:unnamed protein product, partial [Amoebophrya sp. A25]
TIQECNFSVSHARTKVTKCGRQRLTAALGRVLRSPLLFLLLFTELRVASLAAPLLFSRTFSGRPFSTLQTGGATSDSSSSSRPRRSGLPVLPTRTVLRDGDGRDETSPATGTSSDVVLSSGTRASTSASSSTSSSSTRTPAIHPAIHPAPSRFGRGLETPRSAPSAFRCNRTSFLVLAHTVTHTNE